VSITSSQIRDACLCFHAQRAARALARRFDSAFRPLGLTSGQFSLLNGLNRAEPPAVAELAELLAVDRTTTTAALKPLMRRGWVEAQAGARDRRKRLLRLTDAGRAVLAAATPVWSAAHAELESSFAPADLRRIRRELMSLSAPQNSATEPA
jgi:DNA-binding MarR family transcriptional regulator